LWVLPVVVLALGAVAAAVATRRLAAEVAAARPALDDLARVSTDARALRDDAQAAYDRGGELVEHGRRFRTGR
jgi:hypothetical protein